MRTIVGLAIVIAVIWGLAWILRQVKAGASRTCSKRRGLASVAALTLGSGRSVHLVRAGNDYVLLGSTEHGVAPIHRYTEEEALDAGLLAAPGRCRGARQALDASTAARPRSPVGSLTGAGQGARHGQRVLERRHRPRRGRRSPVARVRRARAHAERTRSRPRSDPPACRDPMRMPSPSSGLIERLRELTVRR